MHLFIENWIDTDPMVMQIQNLIEIIFIIIQFLKSFMQNEIMMNAHYIHVCFCMLSITVEITNS